MTHFFKIVSIIFLCLSLTACPGGDDDNKPKSQEKDEKSQVKLPTGPKPAGPSVKARTLLDRRIASRGQEPKPSGFWDFDISLDPHKRVEAPGQDQEIKPTGKMFDFASILQRAPRKSALPDMAEIPPDQAPGLGLYAELQDRSKEMARLEKAREAELAAERRRKMEEARQAREKQPPKPLVELKPLDRSFAFDTPGKGKVSPKTKPAAPPKVAAIPPRKPGSLRRDKFAEPEIPLSPKGVQAKEAFLSFARGWLDKVNRSYLNRADKLLIQKRGGAYVARYTTLDKSSLQIRVKPSQYSHTPFIGVMRYYEQIYESQGATEAAAKSGQFSMVKQTRITEIFRYSKNKWQY